MERQNLLLLPCTETWYERNFRVRRRSESLEHLHLLQPADLMERILTYIAVLAAMMTGFTKNLTQSSVSD